MLIDTVLSSKELKEIFKTNTYNLKQASVEFEGSLSECVILRAEVPKGSSLIVNEESKTTNNLSGLNLILKDTSHSNLPRFVDSKLIRQDKADAND